MTGRPRGLCVPAETLELARHAPMPPGLDQSSAPAQPWHEAETQRRILAVGEKTRERNFDKLERRAFLSDVHPLLTVEERARFDEAAGKRAFLRVFEGFIAKIPGKEWASTPGFLQKHGLADGAKK